MFLKRTHSHPKKHGSGLGKCSGSRASACLLCSSAYLLSHHLVSVDKHQMVNVLFSYKEKKKRCWVTVTVCVCDATGFEQNSLLFSWEGSEPETDCLRCLRKGKFNILPLWGNKAVTDDSITAVFSSLPAQCDLVEDNKVYFPFLLQSCYICVIKSFIIWIFPNILFSVRSHGIVLVGFLNIKLTCINTHTLMPP